MKKKKILIILPNLSVGGAERATVNFFQSFDRRQYDLKICVFDNRGSLGSFIPEKIEIINLNTISTKKSFWRIIFLIKWLRPEYVYSTHHRVSVLLSLTKLLSFEAFRHVARMPSTPSSEILFGEYGVWMKLIYSFSYKLADVIVAQTDQMKSDVIKTFGIRERLIKVINNRIDEKLIKNSIKPGSTIFKKENFNIVASGRIRHEKGFDILIFALQRIVKKYRNFHLYIIGEDKGAKKDLEVLIAENHLSNSVTLEGFQENPYQYYADCDMFILSSRWEGFPNALLENYYLNTPLVSTRCVQVAEDLITEGVNGYLCAPEDAQALAGAILKCMSLSRDSIKNKPLKISGLEECFE